MHVLDARQPIPDCTEDLEGLNARTLELLRDSALAMRARPLLEVSVPVAERIARASAQELVSAIRCGVPLVIFTAAFEEILSARPRRRTGIGLSEIPSELESLIFFALNFAHQLVLRDPTMAQAHAYFGFSRAAAEMFAQMSVVQRENLSRRGLGLLKVRAGEDLAVWDCLLEGDRCEEGRSQLLARIHACRTLVEG